MRIRAIWNASLRFACNDFVPYLTYSSLAQEVMLTQSLDGTNYVSQVIRRCAGGWEQALGSKRSRDVTLSHLSALLLIDPFERQELVAHAVS